MPGFRINAGTLKFFMKTNFGKLILCVTGVCAVGWAAGAASLQRADVMDNPAWLLHVDCDGLRPTTIGQYVLTQMNTPDAQAKLAVFQTIFNFDLRTQLHGVTLYGPSQAPTDGVLIVYADFDPGRLLILAKAANGYQSSPHGQHLISNWIDDKKQPASGAAKPRVYAAIAGNRVIFGQREDRVGAVLDVMDGIAPSLAGSGAFADLGMPGNLHFIEAAARKMNLPDSDPNAAFLKLSQSVELALGEQQQQFQGTVTLVADSEEVAGHILAITQGIVALMKFQTDKPDSVKIANALSIMQTGASVTGTLSLPAGDTVDMMKADAARKAAAQAAKAATS